MEMELGLNLVLLVWVLRCSPPLREDVYTRAGYLIRDTLGCNFAHWEAQMELKGTTSSVEGTSGTFTGNRHLDNNFAKLSLPSQIPILILKVVKMTFNSRTGEHL